MKNTNKKWTLWIIVGITILNAIGMTIVLPLFPFLLGKYVSDPNVALVMSFLVASFAICQFFAAPILGALSDCYGRKPILVISLLGSVLGYLFLGIGGALWILFLGRILDGLTAGNQSALFSYIADSTTPHERVKWFGYIGGAIGIGFMIGPMIGGLLGAISVTLPFYVTAGIIFLSAMLVYIFLPESLPSNKRTTSLSIQSFNTFSSFKDIFSLKNVRSLLIIGIFFSVGLSIRQFNASIFLKDVFGWGPSLIGGVFMIVGICDIISRVVLLPYLLKKRKEQLIGTVGLCGLIVGLGCLFLSAYIPSMYLIIIAIICIVIGEGLFDPSYNARLSLSVEENQQGQLQGVNQSLRSLYEIIVPLGAAYIYTYDHGAVFGVGMVCIIIGLLLFTKTTKKSVKNIKF